jgi:glucokinase
MYLGIEIGGTKLQLGVGPGDGTLAALWRGSVDVSAGGDGIRRQILTAVPGLLGQAELGREQIKGVGIGFGGPVDDATRTVIKSHQITGWDGFPLADWVADMLGWPVALGNDADVAGLAEALFGAGKGLSPIFYITIGSGIGGGLIINGEIYRGCGHGAAEIGHVAIVTAGSLADTVPLEEEASGWAIQEHARAWLDARNQPGTYSFVADSLLLDLTDRRPERVTAQHIAAAASRGDRVALLALDHAWRALAQGISQMITLLCPRRVVIGGGVSQMGDQLLFEPLRRLVAERVFRPFAGCYDIVPAALGEEVVVHGALALARQRIAEVRP